MLLMLFCSLVFKGNIMKTFKNAGLDFNNLPDCRVVCFKVGSLAPSDGKWIECSNAEIKAHKCTKLDVCAGYENYGYC